MVGFSIHRVVSGQVYDTDAAEEIATRRNAVPRDDFGYEHLGLHPSRRGAWLAAGRTGTLGNLGKRPRH